MNYLWQKFLVEPKDHNQSAIDEFLIQWCDSARPTFLHGLSGGNTLNLVQHTNPCINNSESYMFLELSLCSGFLTPNYQSIVRSSCAFVLWMRIILVIRQAILFQKD